jgi:acyl-CoA synthetase (AMP-forming)/AMP-acid ligase II
MTIEINELGLRCGLAPSPMPQGAASIAALVDALPRTAEPALIDRDGTLTYAELTARISAAIARLAGRGVGAGTVVAGSSVNSSALAIAFFAVQRLGGVWVGINPALGPAEKSAQLHDCGVSLVLVGTSRHDEMVGICSKLARPPDVLDLEEQAREFIAMAARGESPRPPPLPDPHAPAIIGYTSGTTGAAKGVVHSQHGLMSFVNGSLAVGHGQWIAGARRGVSISMTIMNLMVYGPVVALAAGGCIVLMDRPDAEGVGQWIQTHRVEIFNGTPTTFWDLLCKPSLQHFDLSSLKAVCLGGGPAPLDLVEAFSARFGYEMRADYGLSEAPASVMLGSLNRDDKVTVYDEAGKHVCVAILDPEGREVAPGTIGELCIGPHQSGPWSGVFTGMLGYWRRPDETRGAFHGAWMRTGDQATMDEHGRMRIAGRKKEMILRGGANIYPAEVEAVVRRHDSVQDVVILGLSDPRLGEVVAAFVKLTPDAVANADLVVRLKEFCRAEIARYKVPERWFVVDDFPRNALNKPLRASIKTMTEHEIT